MCVCRTAVAYAARSDADECEVTCSRHACICKWAVLRSGAGKGTGSGVRCLDSMLTGLPSSRSLETSGDALVPAICRSITARCDRRPPARIRSCSSPARDRAACVVRSISRVCLSAPGFLRLFWEGVHAMWAPGGWDIAGVGHERQESSSSMEDGPSQSIDRVDRRVSVVWVAARSSGVRHGDQCFRGELQWKRIRVLI
jgi:hypothetical protein